MSNRHRRIIRLVSAAVGRLPDDDDGLCAYWGDSVDVITCNTCGGWWIAVEGAPFVELSRARLTRRVRAALAGVRV